jgi:hypothetical protein
MQVLVGLHSSELLHVVNQLVFVPELSGLLGLQLNAASTSAVTQVRVTIRPIPLPLDQSKT